MAVLYVHVCIAMTCPYYWPNIQDICSRFQESCRPSGVVQTALEVVSIVGAVLSLIGIAATIFTLLVFKWVSLEVNTVTQNCFRSPYVPCYGSILDNVSITQETSWTGCHRISCPALHSTLLHAGSLCVWYWPNKGVWRLCACISSDPLLHIGGCDVHGGRSCPHVQEADYCLRSNHHQVLCYYLTYMLV